MGEISDEPVIINNWLACAIKFMFHYKSQAN